MLLILRLARGRSDQKRHDGGMTMRRKVLGNAWVDRQSQFLQHRFPRPDHPLRLGRDLDAAAFDERTRRVLVIGTMVALGQWNEFRLHVRAALAEGGFTPDDIKEIMLQQAIYCGVRPTMP